MCTEEILGRFLIPSFRPCPHSSSGADDILSCTPQPSFISPEWILCNIDWLKQKSLTWFPPLIGCFSNDLYGNTVFVLFLLFFFSQFYPNPCRSLKINSHDNSKEILLGYVTVKELFRRYSSSYNSFIDLFTVSILSRNSKLNTDVPSGTN